MTTVEQFQGVTEELKTKPKIFPESLEDMYCKGRFLKLDRWTQMKFEKIPMSSVESPEPSPWIDFAPEADGWQNKLR